MCRTSIVSRVSLFEVFGLRIVADGSKNTGSSGDSENWGSLQGVSAMQIWIHFWKHLHASGVFQNSLSEELKLTGAYVVVTPAPPSYVLCFCQIWHLERL